MFVKSRCLKSILFKEVIGNYINVYYNEVVQQQGRQSLLKTIRWHRKTEQSDEIQQNYCTFHLCSACGFTIKREVAVNEKI
jgi:hypothetical protein